MFYLLEPFLSFDYLNVKIFDYLEQDKNFHRHRLMDKLSHDNELNFLKRNEKIKIKKLNWINLHQHCRFRERILLFYLNQFHVDFVVRYSVWPVLVSSGSMKLINQKILSILVWLRETIAENYSNWKNSSVVDHFGNFPKNHRWFRTLPIHSIYLRNAKKFFLW